MWFAILGPLLAHDGNAVVDVPKGRQRVLLAALLLLHTAKPVPADELAEMVWDGAPPPGAEVTLQSHVLRLRRVLGPRAGARLVTCSPGYLFQAEDGAKWMCCVSAACAGTAVPPRGPVSGGGHMCCSARRWTCGAGTPLAGIASESLPQDTTQDLEALRLQAEEWRTDAALHLGGHAELVPGLHSLIAQHPLQERFHGQRMLALYRSGRQSEAADPVRRPRPGLDRTGAACQD